LDFERAVYDTRVADLSQAAVLLGTQYRDRSATTADVRNSFVDAYCAQAPLTAAERVDLDRRITASLTDKGWA
jgi:Ser/Thr protein kinase RdoA (MazF antagonist)